LEEQEFETLKMVYQELWKEIRWRRDAEYTVALGVSGFFSVGLAALAAALSAGNLAGMPRTVKGFIFASVCSILAFTVFFVWRNHGSYHKTARHIVRIQKKLNLYEDDVASGVSILDADWKNWGQPGTGRWGPISYTVILVSLALAVCILVAML